MLVLMSTEILGQQLSSNADAVVGLRESADPAGRISVIVLMNVGLRVKKRVKRETRRSIVRVRLAKRRTG